jgi:hypothetical protein
VLGGHLGRLMIGATAFEVGNAAATLLILRATDLFDPGRSQDAATQLALVLYVLYNVAAALISIRPDGTATGSTPSESWPPGRSSSPPGTASSQPAPASRGCSPIGFILAGLGIGCGETAESAALAALAPRQPARVRVRAAGHRPGSGELCRQRDRRDLVDRRLSRRGVPVPGRRHDHLCPAHHGQQAQAHINT